MFTLQANKRKVYIAALKAVTEETDSEGNYTGDRHEVYEAPESIFTVLTRRTGNAYADAFGLDLDYAYTFIDDTPRQRFAEGSLMWIDTNKDSEADYTIVAARRSLTHTLYAVKSR